MSKVVLVPRNIGAVEIDAFLYEQHNSSAAITDNPIEDGSSITDHSYMRPKRLVLELLSESAGEIFNALVEQQALREPFELVSGLAVYSSFLIEDITANRDKNYSSVLRATVELREVKIVGTESIVGAGSSDPVVADRNAPTADRGDNRSVGIPIQRQVSLVQISGIGQ